MVIGREERRNRRRPRVLTEFGNHDAEHVLDLLELVELAWHDCYGDVSPDDTVIEDILVVAEATWGKLISAAHLAVTDWRDLRVAADAVRQRPPSP